MTKLQEEKVRLEEDYGHRRAKLKELYLQKEGKDMAGKEEEYTIRNIFIGIHKDKATVLK